MPLRLLTPAGRLDRSAIMLAVHAEARRQVERAAAIGCPKPLRYAVAFRDASASVWAAARVHRDCFIRDAALAALRPDWQFVMLGPVVKIDPADLPRSPNVHWLGMKRYGELPAYLAHWDCCIRDAALAALPASHAQLLEARTAALMIDSARRMVAELAAIDAQAAALGIRL